MADPLDFIHFHRGQRRLIDACKDVDPNWLTLVEFLKPNGNGGSWATIGIWSAIMWGTRNPCFRGQPFGKSWPFLRSARLMSTKEILKDQGPIQRAIRHTFPARRYAQGRGAGTSYYSEGRTDTKWDWDVLTYDQAVLQAAGANKGLLVCSEPPPHNLLTESVTRLRGQGLIIIEMTQMDLAAWNEEYVDAGAFLLDGKKVGDIRIVQGDIEDACSDHSDGFKPHSAILAEIASWPEEEREARKTGQPMKWAGRIYRAWGAEHELEALPDYHADCWERGKVRIFNCVDPHDARPWAVGWFAAFPNEDVVQFAEWPNCKFDGCRVSPITDVEEYREMILATEAGFNTSRGRVLPVEGHYGDPEHMAMPGKGSGYDGSLRNLLASPCRKCLIAAGSGLGDDDTTEAWQKANAACKHKIVYTGWPVYQGSVAYGHMLVRQTLGDTVKGIRPKSYAMKEACPNSCYAMRHYAFKDERNAEKRGAEKPSLIHKDFPDLWRGGYMLGWQKWPDDVKDLYIEPRRTGGPGSPKARVAEVRGHQVPPRKTTGLNISPPRSGKPQAPKRRIA